MAHQKGFSEGFYRDFIHGNLQQTKDFITHAVTYPREGRRGQPDRAKPVPVRKAEDGPVTEPSGTARTADAYCHIELTTLIIPGYNDTDAEMEEECAWIASLDQGKGKIPLHISRYFPRYHLDIPATPVRTVYHLAEVARRKLRYVYTGNC